MHLTKLRTAAATFVVAVTFSTAAAVVTTDAQAAAPNPVKAGSSGNAKLDDVCRQMADLINDEINQGNAEDSVGPANAWYNQARDHIHRAQQAGCVISRVVPTRGVHFGATFSAASFQIAAKGSATPATGNTTAGSSTVARKKISGRATGRGQGMFDQSTCDAVANNVNYALGKADEAALAGDAALAAAWREYANEALAAGSKAGCVWSAALRMVHANVAPHGTTVAR
jgi:hypothetical protein